MAQAWGHWDQVVGPFVPGIYSSDEVNPGN